jgi:hypothetical protein
MIVNLVVGEATGQIADAGSMADVRR